MTSPLQPSLQQRKADRRRKRLSLSGKLLSGEHINQQRIDELFEPAILEPTAGHLINCGCNNCRGMPEEGSVRWGISETRSTSYGTFQEMATYLNEGFWGGGETGGAIGGGRTHVTFSLAPHVPSGCTTHRRIVPAGFVFTLEVVNAALHCAGVSAPS